ncbi:GNAT family N-acetyltransferase [Salisaeta longa]|uniref:GNAT family N-acetyltransferase n=1 Tax=Salisaeta longa TaxID=503170 RepID=UPI0003B3C272|nr:GNAT family N-acetyltransferase [Salisaeta longa]
MTSSVSPGTLRKATAADVAALDRLIEASVRALGPRAYTPAQIEASLKHLFGVDTQLIADGTYLVVERDGDVVGSGGWSWRQTPFGGDQAAAQNAAARDPSTDPAVIRAFFVHPAHTRSGIASWLLDACEAAARDAGFTRFALTATHTGHAFYRAAGYRDVAPRVIDLPGGTLLEAIDMEKP